ncbi:unnamed protein product [Microthlaspi erraticum]|uniref:Uncharacterized protein n=1 Tax=Microthlaspi erraticum TaxID=1685480 RepID=A0A6D2L4P3_9BRAS|nr:unnamed protein product [Microthlaspi erraticum]
MRIEDTSYGNSKHLGSIYNRLQALEGSSHANYKRERSPTPNHPPFYCNAITRRSTTKSMRTMKKKKESMRNKMMKMKSRASTSMLPQNRAWIHLALLTLVSHHQEVKLLHFQDWKQCKDHHHLLKKKILGI